MPMPSDWFAPSPTKTKGACKSKPSVHLPPLLPKKCPCQLKPFMHTFIHKKNCGPHREARADVEPRLESAHPKLRNKSRAMDKRRKLGKIGQAQNAGQPETCHRQAKNEEGCVCACVCVDGLQIGVRLKTHDYSNTLTLNTHHQTVHSTTTVISCNPFTHTSCSTRETVDKNKRSRFFASTLPPLPWNSQQLYSSATAAPTTTTTTATQQQIISK